MSRIVKRISSPYLLVATNAASTVFTVGEEVTNNAEVVINGNLVVRGNSTTVESVDTKIFDNIITLNAGLSANTAPTLNAGIEVNRGNATAAVIRWNETTDHWELTNDGATYQNISTQIGGSFLSVVFDDKTPMLGGNLDTNDFSLTATNNITLSPGLHTRVNSALQLQETLTPPANTAGYNLVYASTVSGGGTGIYVTNGQAANQEMVSKRRAIVYSLIF
jgi:hypothetical protein